MSANITNSNVSAIPNDDGRNLIWIYLIWIAYLFTTALPNLLFSLAVVRYAALRARKEYLLIGGLCFADFLATFTYFIAGVQRLQLIFTNQWSGSKRSVFYCVSNLSNSIWWLAAPTSGLMLVVVNFDRLLAVAVPMRYFSLKTRYAKCMLTFAYGVGLVHYVVTVGMAFADRDDEKQIGGACFAGAAILGIRISNSLHANFNFYVLPVTGAVSVALYVALGFTYWKRKQQVVAPNRDEATAVQERKRQNQLTKSLAVSSVCTTSLLVIPSAIAFTGDTQAWPRVLLQFLWLLPPVNPFCNVLIYWKRQKDLKKAILSLVKNKSMPPALNLWQVSRVTRTVQSGK